MGGAGKNLIWQHKNATEWLGLQMHSSRISSLEYFPPHVHLICFNYHQVYIQGTLPSEAYNLSVHWKESSILNISETTKPGLLS